MLDLHPLQRQIYGLSPTLSYYVFNETRGGVALQDAPVFLI